MRKLRLRPLLLGCMLLLGQVAWSNVRDVQMHFLGIKDGLSHQTANCFCQDEFGFIWIGTQDGLNRFDGRSVDIFRPDGSPNSIASNNIRQLYSDQRGSIYLRSHASIERYDQRLNCFEMIHEGDVQTMACDSNYLYWVEKAAIFRLDLHNKEQHRKPQKLFSFAEEGLATGNIANLALTDRGFILSSSKLGVVEIVDGKIVHREGINGVYSLYYEESGHLWVATRGNGLYRFDPSWQATHFTHRPNDPTSLIHTNVRAVIKADEGLYYVASYGGLQLLDLERGAFTLYNYEQESGIKLRSIISMFCDNRGTIWMGTFHCGVQYYHSSNDDYRFYRIVSKHPGELTSPIICAMIEDNDSNIWLGTEGNGLIRFSTKEETFHLYEKIGANEVIKALYLDAEHNILWAATLFHGIYRIDLHSGQTTHIDPLILDVLTGRHVDKVRNPTCIIEDDLGNLLVCCQSGLVRLDCQQLRFEAIDNEAIFRRSISQLWDIAKQGDYLWMSSTFDVIRLSRKTGKVDHYSFADISGTNTQQHITHLLVSRAGELYLGSTGSGIFRYNAEEDRFEHIGHEHGLSNGFITAMAEGATIEGNTSDAIYVAHSHGVSRIDNTMQVDTYNPMNNFTFSNINENGLLISRDNHLFICGPQGILKIQAQQFAAQRSDYQIHIKGISVDNHPVMPHGEHPLMEASPLYQHHMVLPSRYSSVSFHLANNNYLNLPHQELECRLEGFDEEFRPVDNRSVITYMNLRAGTYRFVVRGTREEGMTSPETTFTLRVRAPLYARTWFQLFVGLILLLIFIKLVQMRLHRQQLEQMLHLEQVEKHHIEQANAQKLRFFTNLSHEFRTPLTLITGQVEMLLSRQDIKPSVYNKVLNIFRNTQRLKHMVDEIIDIRRLEQSSLHLQVGREDLTSAVKTVWLSFHDFAAQHHIDFHFEAPEQPIEVDFDRRQMERVLNNLLSNAFKYTSAEGSITVALATDDHHALITVADTGIGIAPEHLDHIFERFWQEEKANASIEQYGSGIGLSLVKNLVEMHDGTIEVESTQGKGTTFRVHLPLVMRRDNPHACFTAVGQEPLIELPTLQELPTPHESESEKQPHLLIVEDNTEMQDILRQIFAPFYRVTVTSNGHAGLIAARNEQPDLVLSDIMMPIMSGLELCKRLKTEIETSHIPVVLLTAYNTEEHTIEGLLTGADDYVAKPFNVRILLARCNNIIAQRRRIQARFRNSKELPETQMATNPQDQRLLEDAIRVVERHLSDSEFDIALFAQELGLSRTLLFSKLKGISGQTPNEFILSIRLKRAIKRIDEDPSVSIAEVAYDLGFSTPSYFIRCFRTRFGITPNAYRKKNHG
ncbi:MAG: response regulator [Alistipes sp.]|nr:response regulator [Alistipes sp.]